MKYNCLTQQIFNQGQYQLVPIRHQDLLNIKQWRNAQIRVLRQQGLLTDEMQESYYRTTLLPAFTEPHPKQILFSCLLQSKCIGYGGIVHIDWTSHRGEVSFLVDPQRHQDQQKYQADFGTFLQLIKKIAFEHLHFHRLFTETFDIRPQHVAILESQGFILEGRLREHVLIEDKYLDSLIHGCLKNE